MTFTPRKTLAEQIAEHLRTQIIRSERMPGEKIQEERIAEQLGVSRSPVREALRILEKDRLVQVIPRHGARVTEMTASFVDCLYDIFGELYALGAKRFAENGAEEDRTNLRAVTERLEACAGRDDILGYYEAVMEYASVGRRGSKNPLLESMLIELDASMRRAEYASVSVQVGDLKKNAAFLKRITKYAANEGKGEMAAETVRAYFRKEKQFVVKNLEEHLNRKRKAAAEASKVSGMPFKKS